MSHCKSCPTAEYCTKENICLTQLATVELSPDTLVGARWWKITVGGGYGSFVVFSNEDDAEDIRKHKARWEGAIAKKEEISKFHPLVSEEIYDIRHKILWKHPLTINEVAIFALFGNDPEIPKYTKDE